MIPEAQQLHRVRIVIDLSDFIEKTVQLFTDSTENE